MLADKYGSVTAPVTTADLNTTEDSAAKSGAWDDDLAGDPGSGELPDIVELRPEEAVCTDQNAHQFSHFFSRSVMWPPRPEFLCCFRRSVATIRSQQQVYVAYCKAREAIVKRSMLEQNLINPQYLMELIRMRMWSHVC